MFKKLMQTCHFIYLTKIKLVYSFVILSDYCSLSPLQLIILQ